MTDKRSSGYKSFKSSDNWLGLCPLIKHLGSVTAEVEFYNFPHQV